MYFNFKFSGCGDSFQAAFPQSPRKRGSKSQATVGEKSMCGNSFEYTNQKQNRECDVINTESKETLLPGVLQYHFNLSLLLT
jgi:hypothetical protein